MLHRAPQSDALGAHQAAIRALASAVARARVVQDEGTLTRTHRSIVRSGTRRGRPLLEAARR